MNIWDKAIIKLLVLVCFLLVNTSLATYSAIYIDIQPAPGQVQTVNTDNYPRYSTMLRATKNSTPFVITDKNILIQENNRITKPISVSAPDNNGWQLVKWITILRSINTNNQSIFYVWDDIDVGTATGDYAERTVFTMGIKDMDGNEIHDIDFGEITPGTDSRIRIKMTAQTTVMNDKYELPMPLDSIKHSINNFTYTLIGWRGNFDTINKVPFSMLSGFKYTTDVHFKPDNNNYYRDRLTYYYGGGLRENLNLIGNHFDIPPNTDLKVLQPNGSEIMTPCQEYTIKWKGTIPDQYSLVDFSADSGQTWTNIDVTRDSSFNWTVPNNLSKNCFIRVSQLFTSNTRQTLLYGSTPVTKICYNSDGSRLLSADMGGKITEWTYNPSQNNFSQSLEYSLNNFNPNDIYTITGLSYTASDTNFVVGYYINGVGTDSLATFEMRRNSPVSSVGVNTGFVTKNMMVDRSLKTAVFVPMNGSMISLFALGTGQKIQDVITESPISAFTINRYKDTAVAALLNGKIILYTVPDFRIFKTMDYSDLPIILQIALSPDGKLLGIGCKAPFSTLVGSIIAEDHVIDINSGLIVRTLRKTSTDPVAIDFSSNSKKLAVASQAQPQLAFWDLVKDEYLGTIGGTEDLLTDVKFSPNGKSMAYTAEKNEILSVQMFSYPEFDLSDKTFSIVKPQYSIKTASFDPAYMGTQTDTQFDALLCNTGLCPLVINSMKMKSGFQFHVNDLASPDTVQIGGCINIKVSFVPSDTGMLNDDILIGTCTEEIHIPVSGIGINRNIHIFTENLNFDSLCINQSVDKEVLLLRNDDPVPLRINFLEIVNTDVTSFTILTPIQDTLLQPGQTLTILVRFQPGKLGSISDKVIVHHSNQAKITKELSFTGFGLGSAVSSQYGDYRFIIEVPDRKIKFKNNSLVVNSIENVTFTPPGIFTLLTPLPLYLNPGEEKELEILWNGDSTGDVKMRMEVSPCLVVSEITLGMYTGFSTLTIPNVQADPRGDATIRIDFVNYENYPYNGSRPFNGAISINPRLFLPLTITSDYGTGVLTRNEIVNDRRMIEFTVDGDFPRRGTVAYINGVAGLAETDTSAINFIQPSYPWSRTIDTKFVPGEFSLINICSDRRILQPGTALSITGIKPNPASNGIITVEFSLSQSQPCVISIVDNLGNKVYNSTYPGCSEGNNEISIPLDNVSEGTYSLVINSNGSVATGSFIIVK